MTSLSIGFQPYKFCYNCFKCEDKTSGSTHVTDHLGKKLETVKKLSKCGRCFVAEYCSTECQKNNWPKHKATCLERKPVLKNEILDKTIKNHIRQTFLKYATSAFEIKTNLMTEYLIVHIELDKENQPIIENDGTYKSAHLSYNPKDAKHFLTKKEYTEKSKPYLDQLCTLLDEKNQTLVVDVGMGSNEHGDFRFLDTSIGNYQYKFCKPTITQKAEVTPPLNAPAIEGQPWPTVGFMQNVAVDLAFFSLEKANKLMQENKISEALELVQYMGPGCIKEKFFSENMAKLLQGYKIEDAITEVSKWVGSSKKGKQIVVEGLLNMGDYTRAEQLANAATDSREKNLLNEIILAKKMLNTKITDKK